MNKRIEITCKRLRNMPWRKLKLFQGNLKKINSESLERLKGSILKHGFAAPMFIWHEHDDILDGHQRIAAIESFVEEGYEVPDKIPVVEVVAPTRKRALELVLHYNSQHGKMDEGSLLEYALDANLEWEDLSQIAYDLPVIDIEILEGGYMKNYGEDFTLPDGDKEPFQQMTFTLHDSQVEIVKEAINNVNGHKKSDVNENSNGNALAHICEAYLEQS